MSTHRSAADTILRNGKILTVGRDNSVRQAIALRGGLVQAVGSDGDVMALAGTGTEVIDLGGRTVIPGIVDIHAHMDREGLKQVNPSLEGARSITEIQAIIRREVNLKRPGEWVVTMPIGDPPNYADLAVLSGDLLTIPEDAIPELRSLLTMVGGVPVHRAGDLTHTKL